MAASRDRGFVATDSFGYLRCDPDIGGLLFWPGQVNSGPLRDGTKQHGALRVKRKKDRAALGAIANLSRLNE